MENHIILVEEMNDGSGVYVKRLPGDPVKSVEADEAVTLDYDVQGRLVGIEIAAAPGNV